MCPARLRALRVPSLVASLLLALAVGWLVPSAASALPADPRAFACSGSAGEVSTQVTVTGLVTSTARPYEVVVTRTLGGAQLSHRPRLATLLGSSPWHAGYTEWDVTGPNPDGNLLRLSIPPVLPGHGGFFDADLDLEYAGGASGALQILMFDCTVSGGPDRLAHPASPRLFTCTGSLGEPFTQRTVSGVLNRNNRPSAVTVVATGSGTLESQRTGLARLRGPSPLHSGYTEWDVTGPNPDGNLYWLSIPPVLPGDGGFFDADLDLEIAGGSNGAWQIPMFDCTVSGVG